MKDITPNTNETVKDKEILEKLEKSFQNCVDVPRTTYDFLEETLQIA